MPRASVIIATYARPRLLPRAIDSARAAGTDLEIIVVDDASTDETADVCRSIADIKHVRVERNQGVAGARNLGILSSTSKYVAFLDDDDLRLPGSIDLQIDALEANPDAGFACGAMVMAGQDYQPTGEVIRPRHPGGDAFWELLELDFPIMPLCALIRKECFLRVGLLNGHISSIDDWDIFTRIAELYPLIVIEDPVGVYRQPTPSSGQGSSARAAQLKRVARHHLKLMDLPRVSARSETDRSAIRRRTIARISESLVWTAVVQHLPSRRIGPAWSNILMAIRIDPRVVTRTDGYRKLARRMMRST